MTALRKLFPVVALLALFAGLGWWFIHQPPKRVLVLSTAPVLEAKFDHLSVMAKEQNIELAGLLVEKLAAPLPDLSTYDLVILDAPGGHNVRSIREKMAEPLKAYTGKLLQTGRDGYEARGMDDAVAATLHAYYHNGSRLNFKNLFVYMNRTLWDRGGEDAQPPAVFGKAGIYHPGYDGIIFNTLAEYLVWKKADLAAQPVIALAMHQNYIASGTVEHLDAVIGRIEASGALPIAFYDSVVSDEGIKKLLAPEGEAVADAIISLQIVLAPDLRKQTFEAFGIPVIHTLLYREGDEAAWRADRVGLAAQSIPFFLTNAEQAGMIDPMTIGTVTQNGNPVPIAEQVDSVVTKALAYAKLRRTPNADKKTALMFYNYPVRESGMAASFMNAPKSIEAIAAAMKEAGYATQTPDEKTLIEKLSRLLRGLHRDGELPGLIEADLAGVLPIETYKAWFGALPIAVQKRISDRWGAPENDPMFVHGQGFAVPRLSLGNLIVLPQPPRSSRNEPAENAIYHDMSVPVNHFYLAAYLFVRRSFGADALIHLGTHGSQEWTFGKERGLSVYDDPFLILGDIPVIYPYIVDNIGEAIQTKRRGRAVNITHMTPPFTATGLYHDLVAVHDLIHEHESADQGAVKTRIKKQILKGAQENELLWNDLGFTPAVAEAEFERFLTRLHDHLHDLALTSRPVGLHTFGQAAAPEHRISTVMQMLGAEDDEAVAVDHAQLQRSAPYREVAAWVEGKKPAATDRAKKAADYYERLSNPLEMQRLLGALAGEYTPTGYGGDPIRNPDSLPTGFNHTGFDPTRVPTKAAWEAGKEALNQTIENYRATHGEAPKKLAFSMWSVETMRHFGILEAQVFYALGVEPVWDASGRITGVKIIDRQTLGREPIDVVISATGLYRDQFPNVMLRFNEAVALMSDLGDSNVIAQNTQAAYNALIQSGENPQKAALLAKVRVFSNESGVYGSNLEDAALASDTWEEEGKLAELYLGRMQFAFGAGLDAAGEKPATGLNLYAENLKGVDAAILSRSSNLYGMLTTDDPFQYLGGISLAVRHLTGKSPDLMISNLRDPNKGRVQNAAQFLALELSSRQFHPGYIQDLMDEGHAGALSMAGTLENFWGWQVVDPSVVRPDQWQRFHDVYVNDSYDMNLTEWMETQSPEALKQMVERMLEAVRKEYWQPDDETLKNLLEKQMELAEKHDLLALNDKLEEFVKEQAAGFGLGAAAPSESVTGQKLEQMIAQAAANVPWVLMALIGLMALLIAGGAVQQKLTQIKLRKKL